MKINMSVDETELRKLVSRKYIHFKLIFFLRSFRTFFFVRSYRLEAVGEGET